MRKKFENKLTMYEGVLSLLNNNAPAVGTATGFAASLAEFASTVGDIRTKSVEPDKASTGKTSAKHDAEDALNACLMPVCAALYVYGRKQNSREIMERADITETKLHRMRDNELAAFGADIAGLAEMNAAALETHGITTAKIADLKSKAEAYGAAIGSRESGVAERIGSREELGRLFDRADDILAGELDRFIEVVRQDNPALFDKYQAARVIRDLGIRHRRNGEAAEPEAVGAGSAKG